MTTLISKLETELDEVEIKVSKLNAFLERAGTTVSIHQQDLLEIQLGILQTYHTILIARISDLRETT